VVGRVRIRDENPGDLAAVSGGAGRNTGQLLGGRRTCRHAQDRRGCPHGGVDARCLTVNDGDRDGKRGTWQPVNAVLIAHADPQAPQPLGRRRRTARSTQGGRGIRILLRSDYEARRNTQ
jgi:hypothetical protein